MGKGPLGALGTHSPGRVWMLFYKESMEAAVRERSREGGPERQRERKRKARSRWERVGSGGEGREDGKSKKGPEAEGGTDGETLAGEAGVRILSLWSNKSYLYTQGGPDQGGGTLPSCPCLGGQAGRPGHPPAAGEPPDEAPTLLT